MSHRELHGVPRPLERSELDAHAAEVGPSLLGALLVRREEAGRTLVRIVEVEAYREDDPASHSHRGPTERNAVMFGPPGRLYVYFTYGMHHCMNVSTEAEGVGSAVLLRAAAVVEGLERIRARRGPAHDDRDLLRGPARLTQGLAVDRSWNGTDLLDPGAPLRLARDDWRPPEGAVASGPRTGIRHAPDVPWRFWVPDLPEVSRYVRHPRAVPPT